MNLRVLRNKRRANAQKLQQEIRKFFAEQEKLNELHQAMREVELYESTVKMLRTVHLEADEPFDWSSLRTNAPPIDDDGIGPREKQARQALAAYKPGFLDRILGKAHKQRTLLEEQIAIAREEDQEALAIWKQQHALADKILNGDPTACVQAVELMKPFDDLAQLGSRFNCYLTDDEHPEIVIEFLVYSRKIIPQEVKTLTKTGKLSISKMPVTRYHSLEQDYVCSTIFRIARDMFALLPIERLIVHATDYQMNKAIGRVELVTIVSVKIERQVLDTLNLEAIDPSEALKNFEHRMNFLKTKGFQPVDKLA